MFKKIMVPLDGTSEAEPALQTARELAQLCRSTVVLVRVVFSSQSPLAGLQHLLVANAVEADEAPARLYLEAHAESLRQLGLDVRTMLFHQDVEEKGWARLLHVLQPDLIVMTTHYKQAAPNQEQAVSERVIQAAHCPVLITGDRSLRYPQRTQPPGVVSVLTRIK